MPISAENIPFEPDPGNSGVGRGSCKVNKGRIPNPGVRLFRWRGMIKAGAVKRVLTIAGSDSGGGAGIQADLKTIAALGGYGMSVITALTAQNTTGVQGVFEVPVSFIEKQFDSVASDIGIDAAKTGMLASSDIIEAVAKKLVRYKVPKIVVDPVMVAKGGSRLLAPEAREALIRHLLPLACVLTPNIPEAETIAGMKIRSLAGMKKAAAAIHEMGPQNVLVKGGHMKGEALDILFDGEAFHEFVSPRIETKDTHGTGCTLASAIATYLAKGLSAPDAVAAAKEYVTLAIRNAFRLGRGHGPTNHMAHLLVEASRGECIGEVEYRPPGEKRRTRLHPVCGNRLKDKGKLL